MNHLGHCVRWRAKMLLIISDASVLIDIEHGKLTSPMFSLSWHFAVPDVLFFEELADRHERLLQFGLIIKTMDGDSVSVAYKLRQQYAQTSVNDLLALTLAKQENCQLLTGDKALRKVAKKLNVNVHGTLWLVDQMIREQKITVEIARASFQRMKNSGSHLPWDEIEKMLREFSSTSNQIQSNV